MRFTIRSSYSLFELCDLADRYLETQAEEEKCDVCQRTFSLREITLHEGGFFCQTCMIAQRAGHRAPLKSP